MPAKPPGGAGGTSANDIKAGGASFELVLKDEMSSRLAKVQEGVKGFAEKVKRYSAPLAGGLGQLFEVGARGGALGVGIALGQKALSAVSDEIGELALGTKTFQKNLDAAVESATQLSQRASEISASAREWAGAAVGPMGRAGELSTGLDRVREKLQQIYAERDKAASALDSVLSFRPGSDPNRNMALLLAGKLDESRNAAKTALKGIDTELEKTLATAIELDKSISRILNPASDPAFRGATAKLSEEMKSSLEEPLTGFQRKVADLKKQFGVPGTEPIFQMLMDDAAIADSEARIQAATKALTDFVSAEKLAESQSGKTAREIALLNAEAGRVPKEVLDQARRDLLGGGGVGQLLGMFLGALPDISTLTRGMRSTVAGGLGGGAGLQQFGYGSSLAKEQTDLLKWLVDGKGKLPDRIGQAVADGLVLR